MRVEIILLRLLEPSHAVHDVEKLPALDEVNVIRVWKLVWIANVDKGHIL